MRERFTFLDVLFACLATTALHEHSYGVLVVLFLLECASADHPGPGPLVTVAPGPEADVVIAGNASSVQSDRSER